MVISLHGKVVLGLYDCHPGSEVRERERHHTETPTRDDGHEQDREQPICKCADDGQRDDGEGKQGSLGAGKVADADEWKAEGALGLLKKGDGVQAVYGPKADVLKSDINDIL
jgi:hypothetical protein